jgi:hypothetical protein
MKMSSMSTNHCTECKKLINQIEEDDRIISNLRKKIIHLQDELLFAQKEIIEYQNLKRIDSVSSTSHSNDDDSGQWHISSERQRDTGKEKK